MSPRVCASIALAFVLLAAGGRTSHAAGAEKPFVCDHTAILQGDGSVYYVEGRVHIGKSTSITVQKDSKIIARGTGAVIELEGQLMIHGVSDSKVTLDGVTIEVQPKFGNLHTDMVTFLGDSLGIVSPKDKAVDGRIFVENTTFGGTATVAAAPGKAETVSCDKCWFNGETKEKAIREKYFTDHDDDPNCGVTVDIQKISEKPMQLAGTVQR